MKYGFFAVMMLSIGFCFFVIQVDAALDLESAVGVWLLDEGEGTTASDVSDNGLDGVVHGNAEWVDGKFGKALQLDGTSAYIEVPAHENPREAITISIWVKSNTENWNQNGFFIEKRNAYILHPNANTKVVAWALCNNGCWNKPHAWSTNAIGPEVITEWHMYTATFDSTTGEWFIYIDGEEASTLTLNQDPLDADTGPVFIGNDTCCAGRFGNVVIDEVAIFDVALSPEDIKSLMEDGLATSLTAVEAADRMTTTWGSVKSRY